MGSKHFLEISHVSWESKELAKMKSAISSNATGEMHSKVQVTQLSLKRTMVHADLAQMPLLLLKAQQALASKIRLALSGPNEEKEASDSFERTFWQMRSETRVK